MHEHPAWHEPNERLWGSRFSQPGPDVGPGGAESLRGHVLPEWLLEHHKRVKRALTRVVAMRSLLGVSTRRMDTLVKSLGITGLSTSAVSEMAKDLVERVESFRTRRRDDAGPFTFLATDTLMSKVREGGCVAGVHAMVPTGANADGRRKRVGRQPSSDHFGAGWQGFSRDPTARGLTGTDPVTSNQHAASDPVIEALVKKLHAVARRTRLAGITGQCRSS